MDTVKRERAGLQPRLEKMVPHGERGRTPRNLLFLYLQVMVKEGMNIQASLLDGRALALGILCTTMRLPT